MRKTSAPVVYPLVPLSATAKDIIKAGQVSKQFIASFFERHPECAERTPAGKSTSQQRAAASTTRNRDKLFRQRDALTSRLGIKDPDTGIIDGSRVFSSDECPNHIGGNASATNKPRKRICKTNSCTKVTRTSPFPCISAHAACATHAHLLVGVDVPAKRKAKPAVIAAEHSENVSIDPIISLDGRLWSTQLIYKGALLDTDHLPDLPHVVVSATESVRTLSELRS